MTRIGVRELRQYASRYLDMVKAGEVIEVTERGSLVAILTPPDPANVARDRFVRAGRVIPAGMPFTLPHRILRKTGTPSTTEVLEELRQERMT